MNGGIVPGQTIKKGVEQSATADGVCGLPTAQTTKRRTLPVGE